MTRPTSTPSEADGTAELAEAIKRREFYRLRPDWLDAPTLALDPDASNLWRTLQSLRRLP